MRKKLKILVLVFFFMGILSSFFFVLGRKNEASGENIISKGKRSAILTASKIQNWGLSLKEAMWSRKLVGGDVQCILCPNMCVIGPGERGACGVRANIDGKLRALTYGKPSSIAIDPIEKKPFFHYLPRAKAFSVATAGCNLRCVFCQNWTLSQALPEDIDFTNLDPQELIEKAKKYNCETIAFTYSEPVVFYEYMYETAKLARQAGIKILWKTGAYINPEPARELCKYIDAANIDIKGFTDDFYIQYTGGHLAPVLEATKIAKKSGIWVEVTYLIIPGGNDNMEEIKKFCEWVKDTLGSETPVHFSRFSPNYKLTDRAPTPYETLKKAYETAKSVGLKYVYIGNVPGNPYENTYCPNCGRIIIKRKGFFVEEYHINGNKCEYCGQRIPGVFR